MKKFLALLLAVLMIGSVLVACGDNGGGNGGGGGGSNDGDAPFYGEDNIKLRVWAPDKAQDLTKKLCKEFTEKYSNKKIDITVEVQTEANAATQVLNDKTRAADVFGFASDQYSKLMTAQALSYVFEPDEIIARNSENSVKSVTENDGKMYAFPETDDNGYFLVYDKSVVSDEDAKSLEGIFEACKKAGKKFIMDAGNGFYSCMFAFTGGLTLEGLDKDGNQKFNDYDEEKIADSLEAFANLFHTYKQNFMSSAVASIANNMTESKGRARTCAAGIDGTWDLKAVKKALGENFGVAKLPTINIKGVDTPIVSLHGYKHIGVNSACKFPNAAQALADYLTNEESQIARAKELEWGPSNLKAKEDSSVTGNDAIQALFGQAESSIPMVQMSAAFWTPMASLGDAVYKVPNYDRATLKKAFEDTIERITEG